MTDIIEYVWLVEQKPDAWTISDWNGENERIIDPRQLDRASPDLDFGQPVIRWIGSGKLAQHIRLEYVQAEIAA